MADHTGFDVASLSPENRTRYHRYMNRLALHIARGESTLGSFLRRQKEGIEIRKKLLLRWRSN